MTRALDWTKPLAKVLADAIWPPACPRCDGAVLDHGAFCSGCWDALRFISPPMCAACGLPFVFDPGEGALCGECTRSRPPYHRARSVLAYDEKSKDMILAFKHADRTELAKPFAVLMERAAQQLTVDADFAVPVPLHWRRRLGRRYNQSALMAKWLGAIVGIDHVPGLLVRKKVSSSQGQKSASARRRNVQGAFSVPSKKRSLIRDKNILLVDDVMTTGATVHACTRALLRGGAASVDVITFARVVREGL